MQEKNSTLATAFSSAHCIWCPKCILWTVLSSSQVATALKPLNASTVKTAKGQTRLTYQKFSSSLFFCAPWTKHWSSWSASTTTQDFLGNPFLLCLPMVSCTSTEFLPASCAPCWRGQVFYCLLKQSHRMLCRLQVLSGISFLLAKVYYHLSKIKTELNRTVLVVRTKTVLFKERHKQTHWPQVQPWEQQAAPGAHIRSQHQQMILWGMVISLLLCNL